MPRSTVRLSGEYFRTWFLGMLEAEITGIVWDEKRREIIMTIDGDDVPDGVECVRVEKTTYETQKFVPDART
jgi:hypothetical protein